LQGRVELRQVEDAARQRLRGELLLQLSEQLGQQILGELLAGLLVLRLDLAAAAAQVIRDSGDCFLDYLRVALNFGFN
jgi:hypothetical protein